MKQVLLAGLLVVGPLSAGAAFAHHAFTAEYDQNKPVTLRGALKEIQMTNPHGWIVMDVKGDDGQVVTWRVETGPTNTLMRAGLRKTDFVPGTEIVVKGFQAKSGRPIANGREVTFADGRDFFLGTSAPGAGER
jgi:hypothetical protein